MTNDEATVAEADRELEADMAALHERAKTDDSLWLTLELGYEIQAGQDPDAGDVWIEECSTEPRRLQVPRALVSGRDEAALAMLIRRAEQVLPRGDGEP